MTDSTRQYYRILYPLDQQPTLQLGPTTYRVRDCSERGLSFRCPDHDAFVAGGDIEGTLVLATGERADVGGRVVRANEGIVAVELTRRGLPFALILAEQRRLRALGRLLS